MFSNTHHHAFSFLLLFANKGASWLCCAACKKSSPAANSSMLGPLSTCLVISIAVCMTWGRYSMLLLPNISTSWVENHLSCFLQLQSLLRLLISLAGGKTSQPVSMTCSSSWPGCLAMKDRREGQGPLMSCIVTLWQPMLTSFVLEMISSWWMGSWWHLAGKEQQNKW